MLLMPRLSALSAHLSSSALALDGEMLTPAAGRPMLAAGMAKSTTKGLRLHPELRDWFETFCAERLMDERSVMEAALLVFLEAGEDQRRAMALRHRQWLEDRGGRVKPGPRASRSRRTKGGA